MAESEKDKIEKDEIENGRLEELRTGQQQAAREQEEPEAPAADPSAALDAPALSDNTQGSDAGIAQPSVPGTQALPAGSSPMPPDNLPGGSQGNDGGDSVGDTSGGGDSEGDMKEQLSMDQLQAGISKAATGGMDDLASGDVEGEAKKQMSKINHVILELEQDALLPFDISTFGIGLILTIPARLIICAFLVYQLRKAVNGEKGGWFNLTWESFMLPGADMGIPLPPILLHVAVVVYLFTVVFLALMMLGLLGLICLVFAGEVSMLVATFTFFMEFIGF